MKPLKAVLTHEILEKQTKAFLEAGGKIQYIQQGVTGYNYCPWPKPVKDDKAK